MVLLQNNLLLMNIENEWACRTCVQPRRSTAWRRDWDRFLPASRLAAPYRTSHGLHDAKVHRRRIGVRAKMRLKARTGKEKRSGSTQRQLPKRRTNRHIAENSRKRILLHPIPRPMRNRSGLGRMDCCSRPEQQGASFLAAAGTTCLPAIRFLRIRSLSLAAGLLLDRFRFGAATIRPTRLIILRMIPTATATR